MQRLKKIDAVPNISKKSIFTIYNCNFSAYFWTDRFFFQLLISALSSFLLIIICKNNFQNNKSWKTFLMEKWWN